MSELKANSYIASYKILHKFNEGGMALIYKALQPSLNRTVVIKKLKDPNREIINRFKKEALLSASFHHENLVSIYDFLYVNRNYYLIMEFVDGEDLRTLIDYMAPLPAHVAAIIILGIARGLEYTHSRNIIHRDIKPSNILLSHDGDVKLIDFGIAKDDISTRLTLTGMIVGTPAYMSPEQANGQHLTVQSDLFSLGILLYEMLTGLKPFGGENNSEIMARLIRNKYIPAHRLNPQIPRPVRHIIKKALRKDPRRRYSNATELIHDLENVVPWQLRSHKKEILSRYLDKLNVAKTTTISDETAVGYYPGHVNGVWTGIRSLLIAAAVVLLGMETWLFYNHHLGYLQIYSTHAGYQFTMDRKQTSHTLQKSTVLGPIMAGWHQIRIHNPQQNSIFISKMAIEPGDTTRLQVNLPKAGVGAVTVSLETKPAGATILLDNIPVGQAPVYDLHLSSGKHRIKIRLRGYQTIDEELDLKTYYSFQLFFPLFPEL